MDTPQLVPLHVGSDNDHSLVGLKDESTDPAEYPADATVTVTLVDAGGVPVPNAAALPMPLVAGTTGAATRYRGTFPRSLALEVGARYTATTTATDGSGNVRKFVTLYVGVAG